jgi:hypothetical protein
MHLTKQLAPGVLGGVGELATLFEVRAGDERHQLKVVVDDGQLACIKGRRRQWRD